MSSTEGTPASPPNSAAENGKGVKRSPEQHDQQEDHHQQQQRGGDAVPPPSKTAKLNPPSDGHGAEKQDAEAPGGGVVESPPTDSERVEMEALSSMGLEVGTRLEVLWVLEDEDKSVEKVRRVTSYFPRVLHTPTMTKSLLRDVSCFSKIILNFCSIPPGKRQKETIWRGFRAGLFQRSVGKGLYLGYKVHQER